MGVIYNKSTKRILTAFGSLFNDITVQHELSDGTFKHIKVPLNLAVGEKEYVYNKQRKDLEAARPSVVFPRMSFNISSYDIDDTRRINKYNVFNACGLNEDGTVDIIRPPVPYNISIQLYVMSDILDDVFQIKEKIMAGFNPNVIVNVHYANGLVLPTPIKFNTIVKQDTYNGFTDEKRVIEYTFTFEIKTQFFIDTGETCALIKKITLPFYDKQTDTLLETHTIALDPEDANPDDNYDVIKTTTN